MKIKISTAKIRNKYNCINKVTSFYSSYKKKVRNKINS